MKSKQKTKKAAAKRFSFTASGKIKRKKAYLRHMLRHRPKGAKRKLRKTGLVSAADRKSVLRMLPNHH